MSNQNRIAQLNEEVKGYGPEDILRRAYREFHANLTFATSLGEEDQVITDMIAQIHPNIEIFTLDTGRLFQESYDLLAKTQKRYPNVSFNVYYPDTQAVEDMVRNHGINLFYESVANRKLCCGIRKIEAAADDVTPRVAHLAILFVMVAFAPPLARPRP
jgi:phosphoadenosine phosphosulfate reductase